MKQNYYYQKSFFDLQCIPPFFLIRNLKHILLILILIISNLFASANWFQVNQSYQGGLSKIKMVNTTYGFAIGGEHMMKTTDGGSTWQGISNQYPRTPSGDYAGLLDLSFVSANIGYVVGYSGTIFKTVDGGNTWLQLNINNSTAQFNAVHFASSDIGYVADETGKIYKTLNGGATWTSQSTGISTAIRVMTFLDANNGWFAGNGGVIKKTTDGGDTWTSQTSGTSSSIGSMMFISASYGWVTTSSTILKTTDGGANWSIVNSSLSSINQIYFADFNNGWVTSNDFTNTIRKTTNGGSTWTTQYSGPNNTSFSSLYFTSSTVGYALGANTAQILKTTNGGTNWTLVNTPNQSYNNYAVHFNVSSADGWMVGDGGTVLKTTNGGNTWTSQTSGTTALLTGVYAFSSSVAWFTGLSGTIKKTTDGGSSWTSQSSGVTTTLYDIKFFDANNGLCVGDQGKILKTTNGGSTWSSITSGTSNALRSIFYTSSTVVYIVGHGGTILKSTNGGTNWSVLTSGTTNNLIGTHFISVSEGYACGASGTILKTTNGGTNWSAQSTGTTQYFTKIVFNGTKNGWAVGQEGIISRTQNGGSNWIPNKKFTTSIINAIALVNNGDLVAACQTGVIGKFKEGCPPAAPTSYNTNYNLNICTNTKTTLVVLGEGKIGWYSSATGGTYLGGGETFTTPNLTASTTYYAQDSTCSASNSRTAITVIINSPVIISTTPGSNCGSGTVNLGATASPNNINWYTVSTGGSPIATGNSYTTPTLSATTTYYVEAYNGNCKSASRTSIVATIGTVPTITKTFPNERCGAGTLPIDANGSAGIVKWYDVSTGGTSLGSGNSFTTPSINNTTTYYAEAVDGNCISNSRSAVVATIKNIPNITSTSPSSICRAGIITLNANASAGTINWFATATSETSLFTGSTFMTPVLNSTTTYYVGAMDNGCSSTKTAVVATVNPAPNVATNLNDKTITAVLSDASYQWINCADNSILNGEVKQSYTPKNTGAFAVIVSQNNCSDTSECVNVFIGKINEEMENKISIYPNPSKGTFTLKSIKNGQYYLVNSQGQIVEIFELNATNQYSKVIDNLSNGIYFIVGQTNHKIISQKIVVIK
jgi:photosystem II stability/assembly factor-like uncharacterized protein